MKPFPTAESLKHNFLLQKEKLVQGFIENPKSPRGFLHRLSLLTDQALSRLFKRHQVPGALAAVGGYGRRELFPCSDIDILILLPEPAGMDARSRIEAFLSSLWSLSAKASQMVMTLEECAEEGQAHLSTLTTLSEARFLAGDRALFSAFQEHFFSRLDPWDFFFSKKKELEDRHARQEGGAFFLEPNLKEGPGGLRDLHTLFWVGRAAFGAKGFADFVSEGFMTAAEAKALFRAQSFLERLRLELQLATGRAENRLRLEEQPKAAQRLGIGLGDANARSEALMRRVFRAMRAVRLGVRFALSEMQERLFPETALFLPLTDVWGVRGEKLVALEPARLVENPELVLLGFLLWQKRPWLLGFDAATSRGILEAARNRRSNWRVPQAYRHFLSLVREGARLAPLLREMHDLGVLSRLLPLWQDAVGKMQYDLYHAFTVDEHTLKVVENLRAFLREESSTAFALAHELMRGFPSPDVLFLAAIFHDLGKGRGQHHPLIGARAAKRFCRALGMDKKATALVDWLVENHLLLSITSQKEDLDDPEVIASFARKIKKPEQLDALYLLSVADIAGTNPSVWSTWKDSLLMTLYRRAKTVQEGVSLGEQRSILSCRHEALALLLDGNAEGKPPPFWRLVDDFYFLRYTPEEVVWHARVMGKADASASPVVGVRKKTRPEGFEVMIFTPSKDDLFFRVCRAFERLSTSVLSARLNPIGEGAVLWSFFIVDQEEEEPGAWRQQEIKKGILDALTSSEPPRARTTWARKSPAPQAMAPTVEPLTNGGGHIHALILIAPDRPGLLSRVGEVFFAHHLKVLGAKINTLGQRAEDTFFIAQRKNRPLSPRFFAAMAQDLRQALEA